MGKGKSLLSKTSKPKKKLDKYAETSITKNEYKFSLKDTVVYLGLVDEYKGLECVIIKKSRRKIIEYYKVKFLDDEELGDVAGGFLRTAEEYEELLLDQENNSNEEDSTSNMSDVELKIIEAGLNPMKNKKSCMNQQLFYQRSCEQCHYENVCTYWKKYMYDKVKFD